MIKQKIHIAFFLAVFLYPLEDMAQVCKQRSFQGYWVASLGTVYHNRSHLGISLETGVAPPSSQFVFTVKGATWTEKFKYETYKDEKPVMLENFFSGSTVLLKMYYVPQAYNPTQRKWAFGGGGGIYISEFSKSTEPTADISAAYLIRLKSQSCSDQQGYFRIETGTLVTAHFVKPYISLNMFLLL